MPETETKPAVTTTTLVATTQVFENILPLTCEVHKVKGRKPKNHPKDAPIPLVNEVKLIVPSNDPDLFENLATIVGSGDPEAGRKVLNQYLVGVINEAAEEAAEDAFGEDDSFNPVRFETDFANFFAPESRKRKTGLKKKDIQEKKASLASELEEIVSRFMLAGSMEESDQNRFAQIKMELASLEEALAKKNRRGQKPAAVKAS